VEPLLRQARFPVLSANLVVQATRKNPDFVRPFIDRIVGGAKVTVIGAIADDTKAVSSPRATRGFDFEDAVETVRAEARAARERGAEVVIVLSHCGLDADRRMAGTVEGIDAVIGGHSHVALDPPWIHPKTGVLVAATWSKGSTVGRTTLVFDRAARRVSERSGGLIQVLTAEWPGDPETERLIESEVAAIRAEMVEVLGEVEAPLRREKGAGSSALGNWLCDLMRRASGAEVAIHNKAGIRADLAAGPIRMTDCYQVSPFWNTLVALTLTGREIREELEFALSDPRFGVEVSGMEVRYDLERPRGDRVIRVRVGGEPLALDRRYRVVTNSFLAKGGDGHAVFSRGEDRRELDVDLMRIHAEDVRRLGRVRLAAEPRLGPAEPTTPGRRGKG
jgi:2',3'-cyclic-nucleotide 2'-phosphodiesterase (5'-nucleotidase family)